MATGTEEAIGDDCLTGLFPLRNLEESSFPHQTASGA